MARVNGAYGRLLWPMTATERACTAGGAIA